MIVRMKKLTLLVSKKEKEAFLNKLRRLGVVHVKNVKKPSADELSIAEDTISDIKDAVAALEPYKIPYPSLREATSSPLRGGAKGADEAISSEAFSRAKQILSLIRDRKLSAENLDSVQKEIEYFKPWGGFNPQDIEILRQKGIFTRLYRVQKSALKTLKNRNDIHVIKKDAQYTYIAQVSKNPDDTLSFEEIKPAKVSFEDCCKRREELRQKIAEIENELKAASREQNFLKSYLRAAEKKHAFLGVMHGMGEEDKFSYLAGFCPVDKIKEVTDLADRKGAGYLIEEPDKLEEVPTLIRNPAWIRIISPVFKFMNTIPGYNEFDISPVFLLFFSLFFAMLISDAGYGLLFIALTFFARKKLKKAPKEPFLLMYVLSFATVIWGAVTGTWFGFGKIAELPFFNTIVIDRIGSFVEGNQNFMIYLCFIIGVIQLTIAHLVLAARKMNSLKALSELGWVAILWALFFTAGTLVIGKEFPGFVKYLFITGIPLVLLFSNPQKNILKGALRSLCDVPLKIVSSFSDVVSYLRLFAVGYASTVLASTFNDMALGVGFNGIVASLAGALILFFGHALNIILGLMAVIVHGIRLNMLEFSGQMGMEWSGSEYKPFCETS